MNQIAVDEAISFQATAEYAELLHRSSEQNYPLTAPYQMSLAVWGRCNSPCGYCLNWKGRDPIPSSDLLIDLFHQARDLGVRQILFSGGEPTLRPDLIDLMQRARELGFEVLLITNGLRLTREYVEQLGQVGCKKIGLSLDSLDPERYQAIRGVPLDKPRQALDYLCEAQAANPNNFHVSICVTLSRKNIVDLLPLMHLARTRNIAVQFQPVNFDETTDPNMRAAFWPVGDEIGQIDSVIQQIIRHKDIGWAISNRREYLAAIPDFFREGTFHPKRCYTPFAQVIIDQYMQLRPCWAMTPVARVGAESQLKDIWFSDDMARVRAVVRENKCPGCTYSCHLSKNYIDY